MDFSASAQGWAQARQRQFKQLEPYVQPAGKLAKAVALDVGSYIAPKVANWAYDKAMDSRVEVGLQEGYYNLARKLPYDMGPTTFWNTKGYLRSRAVRGARNYFRKSRGYGRARNGGRKPYKSRRLGFRGRAQKH